MQPRRALPATFTSQIVSELKTHPRPQRRTERFKEAFTMKKMNFATLVLIGVLAVSVIGGVTYAAVHHFSLNELLNRPAEYDSNGRSIAPSHMQALYWEYITEVRSGDANARKNFEIHATSELVAKMQKVEGIDPIVCAQNVPESVTFEGVDEVGSMVAINHFSDSTVKVQLSYDRGAGVFTDIRCPASTAAPVSKKMQSYYEQYINDIQNGSGVARGNFDKHATPELIAKLDQAQWFDPVICAQNVPAMVSFKNIANTSMTAVVAFMDGPVDVELRFDRATEKFTSITCPVR
jgi:hypothetical protein